jgi:enoyl-[acyl-carrier protein] reductase/trans-2-enoyl-CoA reductase (NAD+)
MKDMGLHEDCIEQITRLYRDFLYSANAVKNADLVPVDSENRIRIDDWEMRENVQKAVYHRMAVVTPENVFTETDINGFKHAFLEAHGFDVEGVDYSVIISEN